MSEQGNERVVIRVSQVPFLACTFLRVLVTAYCGPSKNLQEVSEETVDTIPVFCFSLLTEKVPKEN